MRQRDRTHDGWHLTTGGGSALADNDENRSFRTFEIEKQDFSPLSCIQAKRHFHIECSMMQSGAIGSHKQLAIGHGSVHKLVTSEVSFLLEIIRETYQLLNLLNASESLAYEKIFRNRIYLLLLHVF